jgi:hypothetical protein
VLEEIMESGTRTAPVQELLSRLSRAIGDGDHVTAETLLGQLSNTIGEDDPEVTRLRTLLEFVKGEK